MTIYALNVAGTELDERFYKNLEAMCFAVDRCYGYRVPKNRKDIYWLFFDCYRRYIAYFSKVDLDSGYSADLEGACKCIQDWLEDEEALVEEFNWRKTEVPCIDLGQLM
jgi:hypothetical protein